MQISLIFRLAMLQHGYATGLATGDVESAAWNLDQFCEYSYYSGKSLEALDHDLDIYGKQLKAINQLSQHAASLYQRQVVRNLLGLSPNPFKLQGDVFDSDRMEPDRYLESIVCCRQLDVALWMNDDEAGAEIGYRLKKEYKPDELCPGICAREFMEVNIGILCYGAVRKTKRKVFLPLAKKCHARVKEAIKKGNPNMVNFESLFNAELAALKGRTEDAKKFYEESIMHAARRGCVNYQATANERYADYMAECEDYDEAEYRWRHAKELFAEWGAVAKVDQIAQKIAAIASKSPRNGLPNGEVSQRWSKLRKRLLASKSS